MKYTLGVALTLLLGITATSCTDGNDWEVDSSHNRLFSTQSSSISVETTSDEPTQATVNFTAVAGAEKYILEVSTSPLTDDVAQGGSGAKVYTVAVADNENETAKTFKTTLTGLAKETAYYLRVKSQAADKVESHWSYYKDGETFETKAEQIVKNSTVGSTFATITFKAGATVDKAVISTGGTEVKTQAITSAEVEAGTLEITELSPVTAYKVILYNGDERRGDASFTTTEAYPDGYTVITVKAGDDINKILADAESDKIVLNFPQGLTYEFPVGADGTVASTSTVIPDNIKSIYFWGAAGETKPTFKAKGLSIAGDIDLVRFYNLNLQNDGTSADYIINQSAGVTINSIEMEKCTISNTRGVVRAKTSDKGAINNISISDCIISSIGSYGVVNTKEITNFTVGTITISNSTVYGVNANAVVNTIQDNVKMIVENCTFNNCTVAAKSFFDINKKSGVTIDLTNVIIGTYYNSDGSSTIKGCSVKKTVTATSTIYTGDLKWNSGYEIGEQIDAKSTDLFTDPANGDFTLQSAYRGQYGEYGDPRWKVE